MFRNDLLQGKRILVTGGGTGLGKSIAQRYCELGADVVICGRRTEVLDATAAELREATGASVETQSCDIRDAGAVDAMMSRDLGESPARRARQQRGREFHRTHGHVVTACDRYDPEHRPARLLLLHGRPPASAGSRPVARARC